MVKSLMREIVLAIQAKSGATPAVFIWLAFAAVGLATSFAFFCVAAYVWLERLFGGVYAGLIVGGFFLVVALVAALSSAIVRRSAKRRAILERATRARAGSWLLDPKLLSTALEAGRKIGWQRILPVVLLGFIAAQWAREYRDRGESDDDQ
jgi:hypothetical protein